MRQITDEACNAFKAKSNFNKSNRQVKTANGQTKMYLHGNLIATLEGKKLTITNAGWSSNTTKECLNGVLQAMGTNLGITQKNWVWHIGEYPNYKPWDGNNYVINL